MMSVPISRIAAALVAALWLLGCAAGPVPESRFYRLDATTPEASSASANTTPLLAGVLLVERFRADGLTSDRPILYSQTKELEVRQHHYHYWVDSPTDMMQEQMTAYLRARNTAAMVVTPELRLPPDYIVRGRIHRFERVLAADADRAVIEAQLSLEDVAKRRILLMDTYRAEVTAKGPQVVDSVEAFNRGVGEILTRFADDIPRQ